MDSRYLVPQVEIDLARKMVFVAGPRQVGKTTLAQSLLGPADGYRNWDVQAHRSQLQAGEMPTADLWVLDEIHKYHRWRNWLKGLWDGRRKGQRILVTGSARLDHYRRGGDSLQGRYHLLRLHPFSFAELSMRTSKELQQLTTLGGFPEPFLSGSEREARRWSREYRTRLVRDEIVDLERIQDLASLELLMAVSVRRDGAPRLDARRGESRYAVAQVGGAKRAAQLAGNSSSILLAGWVATLTSTSAR